MSTVFRPMTVPAGAASAPAVVDRVRVAWGAGATGMAVGWLMRNSVERDRKGTGRGVASRDAPAQRMTVSLAIADPSVKSRVL
jgi:hypothetical protein